MGIGHIFKIDDQFQRWPMIDHWWQLTTRCILTIITQIVLFQEYVCQSFFQWVQTIKIYGESMIVPIHTINTPIKRKYVMELFNKNMNVHEYRSSQTHDFSVNHEHWCMSLHVKYPKNCSTFQSNGYVISLSKFFIYIQIDIYDYGYGV